MVMSVPKDSYDFVIPEARRGNNWGLREPTPGDFTPYVYCLKTIYQEDVALQAGISLLNKLVQK